MTVSGDYGPTKIWSHHAFQLPDGTGLFIYSLSCSDYKHDFVLSDGGQTIGYVESQMGRSLAPYRSILAQIFSGHRLNVTDSCHITLRVESEDSERMAEKVINARVLLDAVSTFACICRAYAEHLAECPDFKHSLDSVN